MEESITLKHLATILEMRKKNASRPYNLLLTSSLSLVPAMLQDICHSDNWITFRQYIQSMGRRDRLDALSPMLQVQPYIVGYRALARLITKGYFATILTTNIDSTLEDALEEIRIEEDLRPHSIRPLILDRNNEDYIVQALDEHTDSGRIVKLHGSLRDEILPDTFPEMFELRSGIRDGVQRYLNRDSIIVGSIAHDSDVSRALNGYSKSSIYYVCPEIGIADEVLRVIEARSTMPEEHVITGHYGDFDAFFTSLEAQLLKKDASIVTKKDIHSSWKINRNMPKYSISDIRSSTTPETSIERSIKVDILLVTVTEVETKAVFDVLREICERTYKRCFIGKKTYYDFGFINDARIFLVQSEMGTSGPGASLLTIQEGIQALAPSAVVMVGIAFGFDLKNQRIGDILVSQQLHCYEPQRYGSRIDGKPEIMPRGDLVSASVWLLDRFKSGYKDWLGASVSFGLLVSGEKLIDNRAFRDSLREIEPGAIGGEMEGAGLYAAAQRNNIDWLLVKAISDMGDGNKGRNKERNQEKAARNAARFTMHVLQTTDFTAHDLFSDP